MGNGVLNTSELSPLRQSYISTDGYDSNLMSAKKKKHNQSLNPTSYFPHNGDPEIISYATICGTVGDSISRRLHGVASGDKAKAVPKRVGEKETRSESCVIKQILQLAIHTTNRGECRLLSTLYPCCLLPSLTAVILQILHR
jgi:hypothetical protein